MTSAIMATQRLRLASSFFLHSQLQNRASLDVLPVCPALRFFANLLFFARAFLSFSCPRTSQALATSDSPVRLSLAQNWSKSYAGAISWRRTGSAGPPGAASGLELDFRRDVWQSCGFRRGLTLAVDRVVGFDIMQVNTCSVACCL